MLRTKEENNHTEKERLEWKMGLKEGDILGGAQGMRR
jgi:hypothetical protein